MRDTLDGLLKQYEDGKLTRRQLLGAMTALALPVRAGAQAGQVRARSLHHVNVGVSDLDRSETFYRQGWVCRLAGTSSGMLTRWISPMVA